MEVWCILLQRWVKPIWLAGAPNARRLAGSIFHFNHS